MYPMFTRFISIGLLIAIYCFGPVNHELPRRDILKLDTSTRERALEICGMRCYHQDGSESEIILKRADGVVVFLTPSVKRGLLIVIDTAKGIVSDDTASSLFALVGDSIVTTGQSEDMTFLRILENNKNSFTLLEGSKLDENQTYETGESFDFMASWDISTTSKELSIGVYSSNWTDDGSDMKQADFKEIGENRFILQ
jgi:hypothetical protein